MRSAKVAGADAAAWSAISPDERIEPMFGRWPPPFTATRARDLGFGVDGDLVAMIRATRDESLGRGDDSCAAKQTELT